MDAYHSKDLIPVGYLFLIQHFDLKVIPHFRKSFISAKGAARVIFENHTEIHIYPKQYLPKDSQNIFSQLEFAIKYDGINLEILHALFSKLEDQTVKEYIESQPTGRMARRIWYLFEFLTNRILDLPEAQGGAYTLLLEEEKYYTAKIIRSRRHYIDDNLLGNRNFCPIVRKTDKIEHLINLNLQDIAKHLIEQYDPLVIARAIHYLYAKETMSSYEIERERPDKKRVAKFIELLKESKFSIRDLTKEKLIELQNLIVDSRFADSNYRHYQNYIGEQHDWYRQKIHYISPKPEDVSSLMDGLLSCFKRLIDSPINPIITATVISFGFVFIHPFEDGNGRIHRFLIHYILSRLQFNPDNAIFPISATLLKDMKSYDDVLESFSIPLLNLIKDYELSDKGEMTVHSPTKSFYAYIDYTRMVEFLFICVEKTIYTDFKEELNYLVNYDKAKIALQEIVDMPDRKIDLFIQCVLQNHGQLSHRKREQFFSMLTDQEVTDMQHSINELMLKK